MYKYGFENYFEASFTHLSAEVVMTQQWINVYVQFDGSEDTVYPSDLQEPSGLVVFDATGELHDMIVLNEGVDCEYKFTDREKEQLLTFIKQQAFIKGVEK
ncbi:hypothetical protein A374_10288 [Fictibacillus macauensis ZFHKF-1]|uniref:Uncharacterized protein n=1 Tax=Fictibacillus macauensis ZFHKF-1 TaxID=1196324 RepID=I8AIQ6_9BACL|nr:hypothetical protein [Fictibacillus macauensis]EIT85617.1 hypothetical protein A374_10288 [Fictibacillus macauensis ZFHKF-1]